MKIGLISTLIVALALLLAHSAGEAQTTTIPCSGPCPDLVVDEARILGTNSFIETRTFEATDCSVQEGMVEAGDRRLLRFTTSVVNKGRGALHIGLPEDHPELFPFDPCHGHFHITGFVTYRLWTPEQYDFWQTAKRGSKLSSDDLLAAHPELTPVVARKQGMCPIDVEQYQTRGKLQALDPSQWDDSTQTYFECGDNFPAGLSPTWADVYGPRTEGQWVDITGLSGVYVLEIEANANRFAEESSYRNNDSSVEVLIP